MSIYGNISGPLNTNLPITPELTDDPQMFKELQRIYAAIRSVQAWTQRFLGDYPTSQAPAWRLGYWYFDTTLNKLRVGGATGWETITSV
jgi:hypothetical protein